MPQTSFFELNGKQYEINNKGFLIDISSWDEQLRDRFAEEEKITLTNDHYIVIDFLRSYFEENNEHPVVRIIIAAMVEKLGQEKGTIKYFHVLFPAGIHQTYRIAGLPMKQSCC